MLSAAPHWFWPSRWVLRTAAAAGLAYLLIVAMNRYFDPIGLDCGQAEPLLNFTRNERAFKAHHYTCEPHRQLILGTSRASFGLAAGDMDVTAYNLAFSASTIHQQRRYWQHAMALGPVDEVLHLLDLFAVLKPDRLLPADREAALIADQSGALRRYRLTRDYWRLLSSIQTFRETLKQGAYALSRRRPPPGTLYSRRGDALDYKVPGAKTRIAFVDHERTHVHHRWRQFQALPQARQRALFEASLDDLEQGLRTACEQKLRYTLVISPAHAWHWAGLELAGMARLHEDFKRALVQRRDRVAASAACATVPIWDFQGFDGVYASPPPVAGESPHWFDSGHFQPALGRRLIETLRGRRPPDLAAVPLTASTLEPHLAGLRSDYADWMQAHPTDAAELIDISQGDTARQADERADP